MKKGVLSKKSVALVPGTTQPICNCKYCPKGKCPNLKDKPPIPTKICETPRQIEEKSKPVKKVESAKNEVCDCEFCKRKKCPNIRDPPTLAAPKVQTKLVKKVELPEDDVCWSHQPKPKEPRPKPRPPLQLSELDPQPCICGRMAQVVGVDGGTHHYIGLSEMRDKINLAIVDKSIPLQPLPKKPDD